MSNLQKASESPRQGLRHAVRSLDIDHQLGPATDEKCGYSVECLNEIGDLTSRVKKWYGFLYGC